MMQSLFLNKKPALKVRGKSRQTSQEVLKIYANVLNSRGSVTAPINNERGALTENNKDFVMAVKNR
jgi:hypothetical protein